MIRRRRKPCTGAEQRLAEYATMSTRMNSDALASIESKKIPGP